MPRKVPSSNLFALEAFVEKMAMMLDLRFLYLIFLQTEYIRGEFSLLKKHVPLKGGLNCLKRLFT
jgi:hypothetical protein